MYSLCQCVRAASPPLPLLPASPFPKIRCPTENSGATRRAEIDRLNEAEYRDGESYDDVVDNRRHWIIGEVGRYARAQVRALKCRISQQERRKRNAKTGRAHEPAERLGHTPRCHHTVRRKADDEYAESAVIDDGRADRGIARRKRRDDQPEAECKQHPARRLHVSL